MINKGNKIAASIVFGFFTFIQNIFFTVGEGIMFGYRVFNEIVVGYSIATIALATISMILIFKDKTSGYLILILTIIVTLIIYFGHRMLWWPCEYCNILFVTVHVG